MTFFLENLLYWRKNLKKSICLGIFYKGLKKIAKFVNTILLFTKYFIWKERNVVKYQKKAMSKIRIRISNLLKTELSFLSAIYDDDTFI